MICALDTQTLIYALDPKDADKELRRRAKILIEDLEEKKAEIIIPTVAVAEWLTGIEPSRHGEFLALLQSRFVTPTLDLRASAMAARLFLEHRKLPKVDQVARTVLKSDVYIVATAKVAGATVFYSHDKGCRAIASLVMQARDLPTHSDDMFRDHESRT